MPPILLPWPPDNETHPGWLNDILVIKIVLVYKEAGAEYQGIGRTALPHERDLTTV